MWENEYDDFCDKINTIRPNVIEWASKNEYPSDCSSAYLKQVKINNKKHEVKEKFKMPTTKEFNKKYNE